jgi:hypothetical protein
MRNMKGRVVPRNYFSEKIYISMRREENIAMDN